MWICHVMARAEVMSSRSTEKELAAILLISSHSPLSGFSCSNKIICCVFVIYDSQLNIFGYGLIESDKTRNVKTPCQALGNFNWHYWCFQTF